MKPSQIMVSVEISFDKATDILIEPYGYPFRVIADDKLEIIFDSRHQGIDMTISDSGVIIGCYEPLIKLNGKVEVDLT